MGLFNFKKKSKTNSVNQPLDCLVNGELPFGWVYHHKDYFKPKDDHMTSLAVKISSTKDNNQKLVLLQELIDYFYSYKAECDAKGECFAKYFDEMWMHCKNSKCDDFIYIKPYEEQMMKLKQ